MRKKTVSPYVFWIAMSFIAGAVGAYFSFDGVTTWYATLNLPAWTPPNFVFGPVWTILYVCMGIAAALVAKAPNRKGKKYVLRLFGLHLVLNAAWSFVFFGLHMPLLALFVIVFLWIAICILGLLFYTYSAKAGYLMFVYLLWVSYAITLNAGILILNP